jgi:hypothetical protein
MSKIALLPLAVILFGLGKPIDLRAAEAAIGAETFTGEKASWHGFDRYDFLMDEHLAVTATVATPDEGAGFKHRPAGRRCILVVPKTPAPGNPWSWRGCYWDHQPQAEVELLKRGFCIAYVESGTELRPDATWDAWYTFLTAQHGLSAKPAFVGMSRGGEFAYTWAAIPARCHACTWIIRAAIGK